MADVTIRHETYPHAMFLSNNACVFVDLGVALEQCHLPINDENNARLASAIALAVSVELGSIKSGTPGLPRNKSDTG